MSKKFFWLGLIGLIFFLVWSRFYQLKFIPGSLTHDETVYAIYAKAYALTGKGLDSQHRPWQFQPIHPLYAELPATIMTPGFWFFTNSQQATHFMSALMGVTLPFIFGWLVWGIWKNKQLTIISTLVATTNPLWWQFSRLSIDPFFSIFFYFLGGAMLVNLTDKKKLWSLIPLTIGFFQYQGLKPLLVPWVTLIFLLALKDKISLQQIKLKLKTSLGWVLISTFFLTLIYGLVLLPHQQTNNRLARNIFSDEAGFENQVNLDRRLSLISPLNELANNKLTVRLNFIIQRFLGSYHPFLLFVDGEANTTGFVMWTHGIFYLIDSLLIILGFTYLIGKNKTRAAGIILAISLVIFCVPNLINTMSQWHMMRTFLSYSTLLFFISWGAWWLWQHRWLKWLLLAAYLFSVANFIYQYFYRYPITNLDAATFDERLVAHYATQVAQQTDKEITIHTDTTDMVFFNYLLYENILTLNNIDLVRTLVGQNQDKVIKHYQLGRVDITNDCVDINQDKVIIWKTGHSFCQADQTSQELTTAQQEFQANRLTIPAVLDSGETYKIQHDPICQQFKLNSFSHLSAIKQLDLVNQTTQEFCQNWVTDLRGLN